MRTFTSVGQTSPSPGLLGIVLMVVVFLMFAALSGAIVALGSKVLILPVLAVMGLAVVLAIPVTWTLWLMFVALFVILGPVVYFTRYTQLQWLPPLMGAVFMAHILFQALRGKFHGQAGRIPGFVVILMLFLVLAGFSTLIDKPDFSEMLNASRFYLFMWPVMLVIMNGMVKPATVEQLWRALLLIALLQVPFAAYQYFFVALKSSRLSPWDAVVGTFPGNIEGGGQSAAMGMLLLIVMLTAIALWRAKRLRGAWAGLIVLSGIGVLALAEVKAVVLMLPVAIALYYRRELMRRPVESLMSMLAAGALVAALFVGYEHFHYEDAAHDLTNPNLPTSTYERIVRAINPESSSEVEHQLGRITHLVYWWDINVAAGDLQHSLFGFGAGATQTSNLGVGEIARRFPYAMDVSSTTILLWETGLLGHAAFLFLLLSGAWLSGRVARDESIPESHRLFLRVGAIGLFLLAVTLPYKDYALRSMPIQFLLMLMLGQAGYWYRKLATQAGPMIKPGNPGYLLPHN
ncbi:MAG: hypothetical protein AB1899_12145 [Pseudomonadota bacterium]